MLEGNDAWKREKNKMNLSYNTNTAHTYSAGDTVVFRGVTATVQAWRDIPDHGMHIYCTMVLGGVTRAYWLAAEDCAPIGQDEDNPNN